MYWEIFLKINFDHLVAAGEISVLNLKGIDYNVFKAQAQNHKKFDPLKYVKSDTIFLKT